MEAKELRLGNLVYWNEAPKGESKLCEVLAIDGIEVKVFSHALDGQEVFNIEDDLEPIQLSEEWLLNMKDNKNKSTFPDLVRSVHEAQNWYYWNNNKTELIISH